MRKRKLFIILAFGLASISGFLLLDYMSPRLGFSSGADLIATVVTNYSTSDGSKAEELKIIVAKSDLTFLEEKREKAIARGMLFVEADSYVPVKIISGEDTLDGELRLKGHMLDHLEGDKWSYRVKLSDGLLYDGMKRFSLQHPGTRNYAHEWVFHEMLKREGIIALNYNFINLKLNDKDLGVYAVEEHFAEELLEKNDRPKGAIVRFNPGLYWNGREILDIDGYSIWEEYSNYQCSFIEPYDRRRVFRDTLLSRNFAKLNRILSDFQNGRIKTSEVFDVDKLATYHAIIDLLGGHHSLDWSDLKYYLNDSTGKIEPVGYESFSVRKSIKISGMFNYVDDPIRHNEFHKIIFSDPDFFSAYIRKLEELLAPSYLNNLFTSIESDLQKYLAILNSEFPYKQFDPSVYYHNQDILGKHIDVPQGMHGYFSEIDTNGIVLGLGAINTLPIEVFGIEIDGKYQNIEPFVICSKGQEKLIHYNAYCIRINEKLRKKFEYGSEVKLAWRLLGRDEIKFTQLFSSHYKMEFGTSADSLSNIESLSEATGIEPQVVVFGKGTHCIDRPIYITGKDELRIVEGAELVFSKSGKLIVDCSAYLEGSEEFPIRIRVDNWGEKQLIEIVLEKGEEVIFNHVELAAENGRISQTGGNCYITNSVVNIGSGQLDFQNVTLGMDHVLFESCDWPAVVISESLVKLNGVGAYQCNSPLFDIYSSSVSFESIIENSDSTELVRQHSGQLVADENCMHFCLISAEVITGDLLSKRDLEEH